MWTHGQIVSLGCIVCRREGFYGTPAEEAHVHTPGKPGLPRGLRRSIPLCVGHHRGGEAGKLAYHEGLKSWGYDENELADEVDQLLEERYGKN
jgi:hypothetical protein